jgi:hypothetical protein
MQSLLEHDDNYALINSSLNIEHIEIRNILICLFGCLYDHEKAFKIKQGLDMKKKESVANAMELIDMIVKKELAIHFNKLYEPADIEYRSNSLKSFLPPGKVSQTQEILSKILEEKPISYNVWTKACSMYISKKPVQPLHRTYRKIYSFRKHAIERNSAICSMKCLFLNYGTGKYKQAIIN